MTLLALLACSVAANTKNDSNAQTDIGDTVDTVDTESHEATAVSCTAFTNAALALVAGLDVNQRSTIQFSLEEPNRHDWSNLPVPTVPRDGLALGDMTEAQKALAWTLLEAGLSESGYQQAREIVAIDQWWNDNNNSILGEKYYTLAMYGDPAADQPWAFQFDGHHLVYNFTASCDQVVMAPNLLGVQPTVVPNDGSSVAGLEAMAPETKAAFAFMHSLSPIQLKFAVVSKVNDVELYAGPGNDDAFGPAEGIRGADLAPDQQALLQALIEAWTGDQDEPFAALTAGRNAAAIGDTTLVWRGPVAASGGYYYRLRGPSVYVELDYARPDHIHGVLRDPVNDYGVDLLAQHRARFHTR